MKTLVLGSVSVDFPSNTIPFENLDCPKSPTEHNKKVRSVSWPLLEL